MLSDGAFHSGAELAKHLNISRTAVWKHIRKLEQTGLHVFAVPGKGYCLAQPLELLAAEPVLAHMDTAARNLLSHLEILISVDSTNNHLLNQARAGCASGYACVAEEQTAGRGRRGRNWVSPFACNLYISLLWRFANGISYLSGLSLAVGVAITKVLKETGLEAIGLKWPNDILWQGRKLAGILVDVTGEVSGPCAAIVGVGINVNMAAAHPVAIDQSWTDIETILGHRISRNMLLGRVLQELLITMKVYEQEGLKPFIGLWTKWDAIAGKKVTLSSSNNITVGVARGIDVSGALILENNKGDLIFFHHGEVSMRLH